MSNNKHIAKPIDVCIWNDPRDNKICERMADHFIMAERTKLIHLWHALKILPGEDLERERENQLNKARLIILLVSVEFISSPHCNGSMMEQVMQRHQKGLIHFIPIIAGYVDYSDAPFGKLSVLPINGKPIVAWRRQDEALFYITLEIKNIVKCIS